MEWDDFNSTSNASINLSEYLSNTTVNTYWTPKQCSDWKGSQHVLYQLANLGFAVAFLVPGTFSSHGPMLRGLVCCGCVFVILWGGTVTCNVDSVAWHASFLIINSAHLVYAIYDAYPVQFSNDLEPMFHKLFLPLHVSRTLFKQLADLGEIWHLQEGATFAEESATYNGEGLTVLLNGHLQVLHQGLWLHNIEAGSFVNSIEFESVQDSQPGSYQVSYHALEDCTLLTWQKDVLQQQLEVSPEHKSLLHVLLGRDINLKLTLVQEALMRDPRYLQFVKEKKRKRFYSGSRNGRVSEEMERDEGEILENGSTIAIAPSIQLSHCSISGSDVNDNQRSCNASIAYELYPPRSDVIYNNILDQPHDCRQTSIETSL